MILQSWERDIYNIISSQIKLNPHIIPWSYENFPYMSHSIGFASKITPPNFKMEPQELRLDFQKVKFYWRQTFLVPCWNKGVEIPEIQWEEYFLIAISFMFLNLVGHAASFPLDAIGRHHTQKMVNKLLGLFFLMGCPCQASAVDMGKTTALHGDTWEIQKRIDIYHYFKIH